VRRIPFVRLLIAYIAGANLRRIPNPHLISQPLQQLDEPLAVAAGFHANQRRNRQSSIKPLGLAIAVHQLVFAHLSRFAIENRNLLPTGMEITPYNLHEGSLLPVVLILKPSLPGSSKPSPLSNH
jgi:hypothetical protein